MNSDRIDEAILPEDGRRILFLPDCQDQNVIGSLVCGLLNTSGGSLICGAKNRDVILDIEDANSLVQVIEKILIHGISPGALVSVQAHKVGAKNVLIIEVPAGKDLPYAFENVIYILDDHKPQKADIETIRDMVLRKQIEPERWERRFSSADIQEDLDNDEINSTVNAVAKRARFTFQDTNNTIRILEDLGLCHYGRLTNGGDVLFGANPAIRYPQIRVRAACFTKNKDDETYRDMKSFEGALVPILEEAFYFIQRNTPTLSFFDKESLNRRDEPLYPVAAIREGLVNAFVHRDYSSFSGGIHINIYPDHLEIWNAGRFPEGITPETLLSGHISVLRNPDIAHVLYLRGLMEMLGRGSVMIKKVCIEHGLPQPKWSEDEQGVTLTFFAPEVTPEVTPEVRKMLSILKGELSRQDLQDSIGLKDNEHFRKAYLLPALHQNLIEMTLPDKPTSSKQKYRLTRKGQNLIDDDHSPVTTRYG